MHAHMFNTQTKANPLSDLMWLVCLAEDKPYWRLLRDMRLALVNPLPGAEKLAILLLETKNKTKEKREKPAASVCLLLSWKAAAGFVLIAETEEVAHLLIMENNTDKE